MSQRSLLLSITALFLVTAAGPALAEVDFEEDIQPIFADNCYECHGEDRQRGEFRMDQIQSMMRGGDQGVPGLVPGDAEESNIYVRISLSETHLDIMPPEGDTLDDEQIELVKQWINEGADFGDGGPVVVPEADPEALSALHELDALAMPLARDTNLIAVDFRAEADSIGDSQLKRLQPVAEQLAWLNLSSTRITDEGLREFGNFENLTRLSLDNTAITDAGLAHLSGLESLEYLNLYGAEDITDEGLKHLNELESLRRLYLWQTQVSEEGVTQLQESLPELMVDRGWEHRPEVEVTEIEPEEAQPEEEEGDSEPQAEAVNAECPVSGEDVDPAFTVTVEGDKVVAFCCGNCKGQYEDDPDSFADAIAELIED